MTGKYAIAIHGGAGTITRASMTAEKEAAYREMLASALAEAEAILQSKGTAINAAEVAVKLLEDSDLFNAGRGSVFTHEGTHEMDASIMDGRACMAGAVAGISNVKNPIALARLVMEKSEHVFLIGAGAEAFAKMHGAEIVHPSYFSTRFRKEQLLKIRDTNRTQLDHSDEGSKKYGTVGAVALDTMGNLAAATSTGGITNKRYGRVGDTPIIGAGTYAQNGICAVSTTGWGEFFLRGLAAYDVAAMMKYGGSSLKAAAEKVIFESIPKLGGDGGLIAIDSHGNIVMPFNTEGMYRAAASSEGEVILEIYKA
jgi:beta-aspartyl-peptidase (threonine type)